MRNACAPDNRRKTGKKNPIPRSEATRFKPGVCPNPGGRPRTAPLSQACRELLNASVPNDPQARTYAQVIAAKLAKKAMRGDVGAAKELADRAEGRARQSVEIETADKIPFDPTQFAGWTRSELETYAITGMIPDRFTTTQ